MNKKHPHITTEHEIATLEESIHQFVLDRNAYYRQWMFDKPILIKRNSVLVAQRLQKLLAKAIRAFVQNYENYEYLIPLSDKAKEILRVFNDKPYWIGTYRTDFVFDEQRNIRLIEITCRFALNGIFLPAVMNYVGIEHKQQFLKEVEVSDYYQGIYSYLESLFAGSKKIFILKGSDTRNASKIYVDILERSGYEVLAIDFKNLSKLIDSIEECDTVISELALEEIESLDISLIEKLAKKKLINDYRTVFLIHDKRFFSILSDKRFLESTFTKEEQLFLANYTIPSYNYSVDNKAIWKRAKTNKNNWIIKHSTLGKSQKIYAGIVLSQLEWEEVFNNPDIDKMIIQQWIPQQQFSGEIGDQKYEDFITGTLLYCDDLFFGYGDFRTSSHPVINVVDHRKYCSLILKNECPNSIVNQYNVY